MRDEKKTKAQLLAELAAERRQRVKLEAAQRESEQRFRRLVEHAPDIIFRWNFEPSPHFEYISPAIEEITGHPLEKFYADHTFALSLLHPEDRHIVEAHYSSLSAGDGPLVYRLIDHSGKVVWLEQRHIAVTDDENRTIAIEGIARDRTEQLLARAALERSLQEKELLLKEIHHRVKNNLTLVSSLLELQASKCDDEQLREMLASSQKRLLSVARIHEALYLSEELGQIDLAAYIVRLGSEFAEAFGNDSLSICYDLKAATVAIGNAVHLGLVLNELVNNAFRHAFPAGFSGDPIIEIRLRTSPTRITTTISDNGMGLPTDFSLYDTRSLGLQIVRLLTEQMGGQITFDSNPEVGTSFTVWIPSDGADGADAALPRTEAPNKGKDSKR